MSPDAQSRLEIVISDLRQNGQRDAEVLEDSLESAHDEEQDEQQECDREDDGDEGINQAQPELARTSAPIWAYPANRPRTSGVRPVRWPASTSPRRYAGGPCPGQRSPRRAKRPESASGRRNSASAPACRAAAPHSGPEGLRPVAAPPGSAPRSARSGVRHPASTVRRLWARCFRPWTGASASGVASEFGKG